MLVICRALRGAEELLEHRGHIRKGLIIGLANLIMIGSTKRTKGPIPSTSLSGRTRI